MMSKRTLAPALAVLLALSLAGCAGSSAPDATPAETVPLYDDVQAQAVAEATAIIQRARATALILQAQAEATAMVMQGLDSGEETARTPAIQSLPPALPVPTPAGRETVSVPPLPRPDATAGVWTTPTVELLGVSFGAEGIYIVANYSAPPAVAQTFWPGVLSITDEVSGVVFSEVPIMPVIGPLIARPVEEGQIGYVMFVHAPAVLRRGSLVTVKLADYTFQHVPVQ